MKVFETSFIVPVSASTSTKPLWADKVDRWFQLDENGFAICSALEKWLQFSEVHPHPHMIIHASPSGSHLADFDFAQSGAESPAKFVYTLPNITIGVIAQFLSWQGSSYNFTGETSWQQSENFAQEWLLMNSKAHSKPLTVESDKTTIWIVSIELILDSPNIRNIRWKQLTQI